MFIPHVLRENTCVIQNTINLLHSIHIYMAHRCITYHIHVGYLDLEKIECSTCVLYTVKMCSTCVLYTVKMTDWLWFVEHIVFRFDILTLKSSIMVLLKHFLAYDMYFHNYIWYNVCVNDCIAIISILARFSSHRKH